MGGKGLSGNVHINPKTLRRKIERCCAAFEKYAVTCVFRAHTYKPGQRWPAQSFTCKRNNKPCSVITCTMDKPHRVVPADFVPCRKPKR